MKYSMVEYVTALQVILEEHRETVDQTVINVIMVILLVEFVYVIMDLKTRMVHVFQFHQILVKNTAIKINLDNAFVYQDMSKEMENALLETLALHTVILTVKEFVNVGQIIRNLMESTALDAQQARFGSMANVQQLVELMNKSIQLQVNANVILDSEYMMESAIIVLPTSLY